MNRIPLIAMLAVFAVGISANAVFAELVQSEKKKGQKSRNREIEKTEVTVVKLASPVRQIKHQGRETLVARFCAPSGPSSPVEMILSGYAADASFDALKEAIEGDMLEIEVTSGGSRKIISSVKPYKMKPGEDEPNTYTFISPIQQEVGGRDVPAVQVTRFNVKRIFILPTTRGRDGKPQVQAEAQSVVDGLTDGDLVEITAGGGSNPIIKTIRPYEPPKEGEFVKFTPRGKDQEFATVEIKDETGKSQTFNIAPRDIAAIAVKVRPLKEGINVLYKVVKNDKGTFISDVKPAPASASKPAAK